MSTDTMPANVYTALGALQAKLRPIKRTGENPHFGSRFADLPTIMETLRPLMTENGLVLVQLPSVSWAENGLPVVEVVTRLIHPASNTEIQCTLAMPSASRSPHGIGSGISYARRYPVLAIFGAVAEGDDDDGNEASLPPAAQAPARKSPPVADGIATGANKPDKGQWNTLHSLLAEYHGTTVKELNKLRVIELAVAYAKRDDPAALATKESLDEQIKALQAYFTRDQVGKDDPMTYNDAEIAAGDAPAKDKAA